MICILYYIYLSLIATKAAKESSLGLEKNKLLSVPSDQTHKDSILDISAQNDGSDIEDEDPTQKPLPLTPKKQGLAGATASTIADKLQDGFSVLTISSPVVESPEVKKSGKKGKSAKKKDASISAPAPATAPTEKEKIPEGDEDKKDSLNAFDNQEILMTSSTYQPQIVKSLMDIPKDSKEKVEVNGEVLSKLENLVNVELNENMAKLNRTFNMISKALTGLSSRNDEKENNKLKGSTDMIDVRIIEVDDEKKRNDSS